MMENNILSGLLDTLKRIIIYQPPPNPPRFVLAETDQDSQPSKTDSGAESTKAAEQLQALLRYAQRLTLFMEKVGEALREGNALAKAAQIRIEYDTLTRREAELDPLLSGYFSNRENMNNLPVSVSLEENRLTIQALYDLPLNKDLVVRDFSIARQPPVNAMLVFFDGLSDKIAINRMLLEPLMLGGALPDHLAGADLLSHIVNRMLPAGGTLRTENFSTLQATLNSGYAALFLDGVAEAALVDTAGREHRAIDRPLTEQTVRGAQNSFTEMLGTNTAMIRSMVKVSDLITETNNLGTRSNTKCAIMYVKSLANPALVAEVRRRIQGIITDYLTDTGILEQFIEDSPFNPFPQTLSTERPDRVAVHLAEGRIAILLDGSPYVLLVPATFLTLLHSPDDYSLKFPYGSLIRITRTVGMLISVLLPSLYLAISVFHQEALPTDLLLAIATARQQVPFPTIIEILLMEVAFELIREGGIRIPGFLGPTLGIVGAIIIGQAAVMARIVSPVLIVIIAFTGLAAFTIPDYRLSNTLRMLRFAFLAAGASFGFVGIASGLLLWVASLVNLKSFGVPYLAPIAPKTTFGYDALIRGPVFSQELRPDSLNPQDIKRQPPVSRTWIKDSLKGGEKK